MYKLIIMANIAEYLSQLQTLTKRNLEILQAINNSFYTKREHIVAGVGDSEYVIPSFISLENKLNALQENFNNLVYAPKTGEATFTSDGNTRSIEVKGYTCTPDRLSINVNDIAGFSVEQNDIFKDFLTPNPYIKFDLQALPNDITTVNVKKVAMKSDTLKSIINEKLGGSALKSIEWADLYKILSIYKEDVDYVMYDTVRQLPIRKNLGQGTYSIKSIDKDSIDSDLDEYVTLTFNEDLKYKLFDETIEKYFTVGDQLVTYDDSAKLEITSVNTSARQLTAKILNGDYLNLITADSLDTASDNAKIKYFCAIDYDLDKYINVPLEEDRYVCIFISPLNSRMNIQAPWGGGVVVDTNEIRWTDDSNVRFLDYYEENVRNVGDILYEISSAMTSGIMKYGEDDFNSFTKYIPTVDTSKLKVLQINTHLNNSETVQNIRSLYAQKKEVNTKLTEVQNKISDINNTLSEISFNDTTGIRVAYESQLSQYRSEQKELISTINNIANSISNAANNSTIPLENAKYRIRGYFNWYNMNDDVLKKFWQHVHGIKVQYRYKNQDVDTGTAVSIDDNFIFSDWNDMSSFNLNKVPSITGGYKFKYPQYISSDDTTYTQDNGRLNEPSFNQIDIPISQGESVDIRLKIVWDFGFPFIETTSAWSSIVNIQFPEEYTKDVHLTTILEENNNDIETNRFNNILSDNGVTNHIEDKITDQDVTFFHKPENISSGFYTDERRIIPLRDKLVSLDQAVISIQDIVNGTNATSLQVSVIIDSSTTLLSQDKVNTCTLPAFDSLDLSKESGMDRIYTTQATLQLTNTSNHVVYLYSMFPALSEMSLNNLKTTKYDIADYIVEDSGIYIGYSTTEDNSLVDKYFLQTAMQWCTFRTKDLYDGREYFNTNGSIANRDGISPAHEPGVYIKGTKESTVDSLCDYKGNNHTGLILYPYIRDKDYLKITGDSVRGKVTINPGESYIIPIMIHYTFASTDTTTKSVFKYLSFDLRTSLYEDPINFVVKFVANLSDSTQEKVLKSENSRQLNGINASDSKYQSTIKS